MKPLRWRKGKAVVTVPVTVELSVTQGRYEDAYFEVRYTGLVREYGYRDTESEARAAAEAAMRRIARGR